MLTRTQIRNLTHASFYARGLDLYLEDQVCQLSIREASFVDRVKAQVKGSGSKVYETAFSYDTAREHLENCSCNCPAFSNYDGLCKHLVASLLKYVDRKAVDALTDRSVDEILAEDGEEFRNDFDEELQAEQQWGTKKAVSLNGYSRGAERPQTEYGLKFLLEARQMKSLFTLMNYREFGKVRLEPILYYECGNAEVEFRLGISRMYVLKDVFEFAERMREKQVIHYGKELDLTHAPEMFRVSDRAKLDFLLDWVEENRRHYEMNSFFGASAQPKLRRLTLTPGDLDRFMAAVDEDCLHTLVNGEEMGSCMILEKRPPRYLEINGEEDGIRVKARQPVWLTGRKYQYSITKDYIYKEPAEGLDEVNDFAHRMETLIGESAFISKEDVPLFCREFLPALETYYECEKNNFSQDDYGLTEAEFEIYLDAPGENRISCRLIAVYGERRYHVFGDNQDVVQRDLVKEIAVGEVVSSYCNGFEEQTLSMIIENSEEAMYRFLTEGIDVIQGLGQVFISEALKKIKVSAAPRVSVGISLSGDLLELDVVSEEMSKEQILEILSKYDRKKKYYRLKSGEVIKVEEDGFAALADLKLGLGLTDKQLRESVIQVPRYRALYLDERLKEQEAMAVVKDRAFRALIRNMKTVEDNDFEVPESMEKILRDYQKKGFLWLKTLKSNGFGGILADDMGLGKTLQVIAFLCSEYEENCEGEKRCLIVTPASLVYNWYSEITKFAPELPAMMVLGNAAERAAILKEVPERAILITSYDLLKRDLEQYEKLRFFYEVIDEAQFIKNHSTQVAKAVKEIRADVRLALTGTPVENRLSELWSIFDYLMPGFLYGYGKFREELEIPVVQLQDREAMERLHKMIRPFVLRRLKKDVLKDLPQKLEEEMFVCLEGEQQRLYDAHVKRLSLMLEQQSEDEFRTGRFQVLSELTRLRQLCCDPSLLYEGYRERSAKVDMCMGLISNAVGSGHKILLFSQFTSMLEILCNRLEEEGITYYVLTGSTDKETRKELVERFQKDETSVFCISLKAGGTGLNLTAADIVIHYDPWWNLAVQNQATDRAHRIGQENTVTVYKLVTKGTIEENIMRLQEKKRELADQVLGGEGVGSGSFTREELKEIIGG